jgi:hypothetical protein
VEVKEQIVGLKDAAAGQLAMQASQHSMAVVAHAPAKPANTCTMAPILQLQLPALHLPEMSSMSLLQHKNVSPVT